jgi:hypothetical protein
VRANDGTVDDRANLVDLELKLLEDDLPLALLRPVVEPVVDGLPRTEALGQISPRHAGLGSEQYGFDEEPIASRRLRSGLLLRDHRLEATPLLFGERVSMHADF